MLFLAMKKKGLLLKEITELLGWYRMLIPSLVPKAKSLRIPPQKMIVLTRKLGVSRLAVSTKHVSIYSYDVWP
jgi:hypothetical protein